MSVTQNNVSNSSTPGYAKQTPSFQALPFVDGGSEVGGVTAGPTQDSRSQFAEHNVWSNNSQLGQSQQQAQSLSALQSAFDISGASGVPGALSSLYSAFSNWSTATNSASGQQQVLAAAQSVASAFQTTAQQVSQASSSADSSMSSLVAQVNALAAQLSGYNAQMMEGGNNAGLSAAIYDTLQQLSQLVNISAIGGPSGTVTVMLGGGQSALVNGSAAQTLSVSFFVPQPPPPQNPNGPPTAHILDSHGSDISSQFESGSLSGLLAFRNQTIASIQGDGNQTGSLNQMAKTFADQVNSLLTHGYVSTSVQAAGSGSPTSVPQILNDATNKASETVPGQTQFLFRGPGFSDGKALGIGVNLAGVTDMASLATAVNSAIQTAASGSTPAAAAFKNAKIVASVTTDVNGNSVLAFNSGTSAFQVQGGDQTANALMGNFAGQATLAGTDTLPTVDTSVNHSLSIAFNGSPSFTTFTLSAIHSAPGVSKAAIAADLNSQATFSANAKAYVDGANHLIIQSNQSGAGSEVQISSTGSDLAATLGLASPTNLNPNSTITDATAGQPLTGTVSGLTPSATPGSVASAAGSNIIVRFQGSGLTSPVDINLSGIGSGSLSTNQSVIAALQTAVSGNPQLQAAGIQVGQNFTAGSPLSFSNSNGQQFSVEAAGDNSNILGFGQWSLANPATATSLNYSSITGSFSTSAGAANLQFSVGGGQAFSIGANMTGTSASDAVALNTQFASSSQATAAGLKAVASGTSLQIVSTNGTNFRVNEADSGNFAGLGTATGNGSATYASASSVITPEATTYDGGGAQTTGPLTFSPIQNGGDAQTISISAADPNGTQQTTSLVLQNNSTTQNAGSIDQAISALNNQLQNSGNSTLQGIVAVKKNVNGQESIQFMSTHAFSISPSATTSGAGIGSQGTAVTSSQSIGGVSTGTPTVNGTALFTYDSGNATNVASSLKENPSITAQDLAAISGTPSGSSVAVTSSNGVALALANLANSPNPTLNNQTYSQFFGTIAAGVGSQLSSAQTNQTSAQDQLTQSESLRQQVSGVDLNQEASQILQFQQAYTAASKVITVIDSMTQTVLGLVTPSQVV